MNNLNTGAKITLLGQAGIYFEFDGFSIMIDPYLSDSVGKVNPNNHRRFPVDEKCFELKPDAIICTHDHLDHFDPETLEKFITSENLKFCIGPSSVWKRFRELAAQVDDQSKVGGLNFLRFNRHAQWSFGDVLIKAVRADHSDPDAIGIIIEYKGARFFVTGDTLYNTEIFEDVDVPVDMVFLPINGVGNNMNAQDAARFVRSVEAEKAVPLHFGLFDGMTGRELEIPCSMILENFKEYGF